MMLLPCPWCGPRDATEFNFLGESRNRPDPGSVTIEQWRDHLYLRANHAGEVTETWYHRAGCRRHLVVVRDLLSNGVRSARSSYGSSVEASEEPQ